MGKNTLLQLCHSLSLSPARLLIRHLMERMAWRSSMKFECGVLGDREGYREELFSEPRTDRM